MHWLLFNSSWTDLYTESCSTCGMHLYALPSGEVRSDRAFASLTSLLMITSLSDTTCTTSNWATFLGKTMVNLGCNCWVNFVSMPVILKGSVLVLSNWILPWPGFARSWGRTTGTVTHGMSEVSNEPPATSIFLGNCSKWDTPFHLAIFVLPPTESHVTYLREPFEQTCLLPFDA